MAILLVLYLYNLCITFIKVYWYGKYTEVFLVQLPAPPQHAPVHRHTHKSHPLRHFYKKHLFMINLLLEAVIVSHYLRNDSRRNFLTYSVDNCLDGIRLCRNYSASPHSALERSELCPLRMGEMRAVEGVK